MTSTQENQYYHQDNKLIKLEGPHKAILIGQLMNESLTNLLWTTEPTLQQPIESLFPDAAIVDSPASYSTITNPSCSY